MEIAKRKSKPLFVLDKWCNGNKLFGSSAWESNFIDTYEQYVNEIPTSFHFDEYRENKNDGKANETLLGILNVNRPDYIFLIIYEQPTESDRIIRLSTLRKINQEYKIPIVTIFGDLEHTEQRNILRVIEPFVDLVLYTALAPPGIRYPSRKLKYSWVPKCNKYFFARDGQKKTLDVSYVGSSKPERVALLSSLDKQGIQVFHTGGERQVNLKPYDYAEIMRNSKISISFSRAVTSHVANARVFEVTSCKSLLLEQEGMETLKLFKPFVDYIPYFGYKDCAEKIEYFLRNDLEREGIINNAYDKLNRYFSVERFWGEIESLIIATNNSVPILKVRQSSVENYWSQDIKDRAIPILESTQLVGFAGAVKIRYIILDWIARYSLTFSIHRMVLEFSRLPGRVLRKFRRILSVNRLNK